MSHLFDRLRITRRRALQCMASGVGALLAGCSTTGRTAATETLQRRVRGKVVTLGDVDYESTRAAMVYNARLTQRRPEMIVHAAGVDDVQQAVNFARENGLKVAVRCGGHHWAMPALREGGALIDVAALTNVVVDLNARTAIVEPAARNIDLAKTLGEHDLAFPYGHCPTVAMGGYLLGGGFGWNSGQWGIASWNVTAVDVVTADGRLVRADERENADLFWAARGGGPGFFGVIVAYHLKLYALPTIRTSTLIFPIDRTPDVAAWLVDTFKQLPANVEVTAIFPSAPPEMGGGRLCVVMAAAFAPDDEQADRLLEPISACPIETAARTPNVSTPFDALFAVIDQALPAGLRYHADTQWLDGDLTRMLVAAAEEAKSAPSPRSIVLAALVPSAIVEADQVGAFSKISPLFVATYAAWNDASADDANTAWLRRVNGALKAWQVGRYVGEADLEVDDQHTRDCYTAETWNRLADIRLQYDPRGVFHGPMSG